MFGVSVPPIFTRFSSGRGMTKQRNVLRDARVGGHPGLEIPFSTFLEGKPRFTRR